MNNFLKRLTNKKSNSSQNEKGNEEEMARFSETSTSTAAPTTSSSSSSQDGPLLLIDVIVNESQNHYDNEIKKLFKDIEDINQDDISLIKKIETLLREDDKNYERISDAKTGNENINLLHLAAKTNRPNLSAFLIDELNIDIDSLTKTKQTPLHLLIKNYDTSLLDDTKLRECLQIFLERNPNLNLIIDQQTSLLHLAISKQNKTAVQMLITQQELNLNLKDTNNMIPLRAACHHDSEDILNLLIDKTSSDHLLKDCQLLHLICACKQEKFTPFKNVLFKLKPILNIQLIINSLDDSNRTVLELAIDNNHLKIADLILSELKDKEQFDSNGNLPIHLVAKHATTSLFDLVIKHSCVSFKANLLQQDNPLHIAAKFNNFNFIKQLILFEKVFIDKLDSNNSYVPMVKCLNKRQLTPLQISIVKNYKKSTDELLQSNQIDLECVDVNNYSIYHLCIKYSNLETLRCFLNKKNEKFYQALLIRSKMNETPLHLACQLGNLEAFKQILFKIKNTNAQLVESYLKMCDLNNRNCFHLACLFNHFNIMEYVLKDLQMRFFLELIDANMNTCLLIAADCGYSKLACLLVDYGADLNVNNKEMKNPYEVALLKGNYETCKYLISSESIRPSSLHLTVAKNCLHLLEILLNKGADLDSLNKNKQNCLDIALKNSSYECIELILRNKNWHKLFNKSNTFKKDFYQTDSILDQDLNRQLNSLFNAKLYHMIEIILDNSKINPTTYDFTILDVKHFANLNEHPLMKLAQSNQDNLLKHDTTRTLIHLKWIKLPCVLFYFNLILHLLFLIMFSFYSIDLTYLKQTNILPNEFSSFKSKRNISNDYNKYYSLLTLLISIHLFKLSIVLVNSCHFLFRIESSLEIISLISGLISLNSSLLTHKISFSSICLITGYLNFILLFQMIHFIGLYVIAFKHTCLRTLRILPLFFIIYSSFNLTQTIKTTSQFNLNQTKWDPIQAVSNYDLVLVVLLTILINLCIGIGVYEINSLMNRSLNEQTSKKLIFVLRVQNAIRFLNKNKHLKQVFNMTYTKHSVKSFNLNNLFKCLSIKSANTFKIQNNFNKKNSLNNDNRLVLSYNSSLIESKLNDLELNLINKHKRLEDSLAELERISLNNFDLNQQLSVDKLTLVENNFVKTQMDLRNSLFDLKNYVILKFSSLKQSLVQTIRNFEYDSFEQNLKLLTSLDSIHEKINYITDSIDSIKQVERDEFKLISNNFLLIDSRLSMFQIELERLVKKMENVESQITVSDYKLNVIEIMVRNETFSAKLEQIISKLDELNDRQFSVEKTLTKLNYDSRND